MPCHAFGQHVLGILDKVHTSADAALHSTLTHVPWLGVPERVNDHEKQLAGYGHTSFTPWQQERCSRTDVA